ncbi:MAG TPA: IPT/TIG domain-containing protein [Bryobacteraceae bacterium]|nr:IPT/TIG domain-containing protein [Bryobacteraceae bacterium]
MKRLLRYGKIFLFTAFSAIAFGQIDKVMNAASLLSNTAIAPGSIITIKGTNLGTTVFQNTDPANPPLSAIGTTVNLGSAVLPLDYVSTTQINAVVPPSVGTGSQTLTVTSSKGTFTATVQVDPNAPPGLFSLLGTGSNDAAVVDALTGRIGAFAPVNAGGQTFLSIFLTGLNLTASPTVTLGGVSVPVLFFGKSPCCVGLEQINISLPSQLQGAGRVPLVVQAGTSMSNVVEVVLLPNAGQGPFKSDDGNADRSRELAAIAWIPGTSLALIADENDDVVRVADISKKQITKVISLPQGSEPVALAVNAAGATAVVAERKRGKVAILDLSSFQVSSEVTVGMGPVGVAISGNLAAVVNGDDDTVSIVNITAKTASAPIPVGHGPRGVAADLSGTAYVTNQSDGTISVITMASATLASTINLGTSVRPQAIQLIPGTKFAVVTVPSAGPDGQVLIVNVTTANGSPVTVSANPDRSGGSSDVAVTGSTAYFANQTGGSVSMLQITSTGSAAGPPTAIRVDLGARALAIDVKDKLLLVTNEGSGTVVLINLADNTVAGRIDAVHGGTETDDGDDDHSDRNGSSNIPVVTSVAPATTKATATFTITIKGSLLTGATDVVFVDPTTLPGNSGGHGKGDQDNGPFSSHDSAFSTSNIVVSADGSTLTATIKVTQAKPGSRVVRVATPNGESSFVAVSGNTIQITP